MKNVNLCHQEVVPWNQHPQGSQQENNLCLSIRPSVRPVNSGKRHRGLSPGNAPLLVAFAMLLTLTAHKSGLRTLPVHHHDGNGAKSESALFTLTTTVVVGGGGGTRVHRQTSCRGKLEKKRPEEGWDPSSQPAVQVYIKSGWSSVTATHKNVNGEIWDEGDTQEEHAHTQPEGLKKTVRTGLDNVPLKGRTQ